VNELQVGPDTVDAGRKTLYPLLGRVECLEEVRTRARFRCVLVFRRGRGVTPTVVGGMEGIVDNVQHRPRPGRRPVCLSVAFCHSHPAYRQRYVPN
jgi:hypothetical protein